MDSDNNYYQVNQGQGDPNTGSQYNANSQFGYDANAQNQYNATPPNGYNQYGGGYQQPTYASGEELDKVISMGDWMLSMLIMLIPCVGFVMVFIWAFGKDTPKSKSNFFKAYIIWMIIGMVINTIILAAFGSSIMYMIQAMY